MAELVVEGDELVVRLRPVEKLEGAHGELKVPLSSVTSVEVLDDAMGAVHGFKLIGARIPGSVAVGTFSSGDARIFAVVHHDTPRGVKVDLQGTHYDQLIVGCDDPEAVVARLRPSA